MDIVGVSNLEMRSPHFDIESADSVLVKMMLRSFIAFQTNTNETLEILGI